MLLIYYLKRASIILRKGGVRPLISILKYRLLSRGLNDNNHYQSWIDNTEKPYLKSENYIEKISAFSKKPKISILMPVYNVDPKILEEAIESVRSQWYENWELCLYDDASTNQETVDYLKKLKKSEDLDEIKIKFGKENENISGATNEAFSKSTGEYVMLADNDDVLRPHALYEIVKLINEKGPQDLIYFDEDKLDKFGQRIEPWFKPGFSPELLYSMMYPTHAVYSRGIFEKAGKMRKGYEGSQDYDLCLRVVELTDKVEHIPWVLYSWRKVEGSTADDIKGKTYAIDAAKNALVDALKRRGLNGQVKNDHYPFVTELKPKSSNAKIDIIIPTKDNLKYLKPLVESIQQKTAHTNYQVTIINNNSKEEKTLRYFEEVSKLDRVRVLDYSKKFNYSAINNFGADNSDADFFLFLNNDMKVLTEGWLEKLLAWAEQEEIGAVGCKLLYPDRTVQHAGVVLGVGGIANHAYYKLPEANQFYYNQLHSIKNYLAVTGACLMIGKEKFMSVGGFEESLPFSFNDVDFCLKLREEGLRNLYLPNVELNHFESKSRDPRVLPHEDEYMKMKWARYVQHDPYYNSHLNRDLTRGHMFGVSSSTDEIS